MNGIHALLQMKTVCITITLLVGFSASTFASEGGSSSYLQGTYGEFASGMLGDSGFYMRDDLFYYSASIGVNPLGGAVSVGSSQDIWGNLFKFAYVSDMEILGGRYNAALAIPLIVHGSVSAKVAGIGPQIFREGNVSGIGDAYLTPFALGWDLGNHHVNANLSFVAPTGGYDKDKLLNAGRNYWSFDPTVYYTWLQPERGHEVTVTLGYMMNDENSATNYTTGDEMHLDWTLSQHFSPHFAVALTGYWYEQITHDKGDPVAGIDIEKFSGSGVGVGPAVYYSREVGGKNINFIAKWITDIESENRMDGDIYMVSVAFKF